MLWPSYNTDTTHPDNPQLLGGPGGAPGGCGDELVLDLSLIKMKKSVTSRQQHGCLKTQGTPRCGWCCFLTSVPDSLCGASAGWHSKTASLGSRSQRMWPRPCPQAPLLVPTSYGILIPKGGGENSFHSVIARITRTNPRKVLGHT